MGAILFVRHATEPPAPRSDGAERAVASMESRGMQEKARLRRPGFEIHVYRKRRFDTENAVEFDNGDFIVGVGTLVYDGKYGEPALRALFEDYRNQTFSLDKALGHFAVFIYEQGRLDMFTDYRGMYQLYANEDQSLVSSSYLAIYDSLSTYTPNVQEICEYLTLTMFFGRKTLIKEIQRVDARFVHTLLPVVSTASKPIDLSHDEAVASLDAHVDRMHAQLYAYFSQLVSVFGDRISTGLTGGFDSRLILAYLRHCGASPRVYVQGAADSVDVRVAKQIASIVGFEIEHDAGTALPEFEPDEFAELLGAGSRYTDGIPHMGVFDAWTLVAQTRSRLRRPESLRLYGMGGEILRRVQQLPNRLCTPVEFLTIQADKADTSAYKPAFSKSKMFSRLGAKLVDGMQLAGGMISPAEAELAYPRFRLSTITGIQMTCENERAHALVPYAEAAIVDTAGRVPLTYREHGVFQAALIGRADPALAAAPSAYGYSPSDGPGLKARIRRRLVRALPLKLRPVMHRVRKRLNPKPMPAYLRSDYLRAVFPDGQPHIDEWVDVQRIRAPDMLSRALTVELLLSGRLSTITS